MSNTSMKRLTLLFTVCLSMFFATAISTFAADAIKYLDEKGEEQTCEDYKLVSGEIDKTGVTLGNG